MIHILEILNKQEIDEVILVIKKHFHPRRNGEWADFRGIILWLEQKQCPWYHPSEFEINHYSKLLLNYVEHFPETIKNKILANSL